MDMFDGFFNGKKVFVTGHTGFKGAWLCIWLHSLGADVTGYALRPPTEPSLFELCGIDTLINSVSGDIRDFDTLKRTVSAVRPQVVIHMAAQSLVRESYKNPIETYQTNVIGTVNLLEAVRNCADVRAVINVTSDKCYENREHYWGYREIEPMGGYDPYSNSKACSELITASYRSSFFNPADYGRHGVATASARAGNVIGGGDWAVDRLIPDCVRGLLRGENIAIRNPSAIRPWQHVLEPLGAYLLLARKLCENGPVFAGGWNFGPDDNDVREVEWIVKRLCASWGDGASYSVEKKADMAHEAQCLKLDCSKAKRELSWRPRWGLGRALDSIIEWTRAYRDGEDLRKLCLKQVNEYTNTKVDD